MSDIIRSAKAFRARATEHKKARDAEAKERMGRGPAPKKPPTQESLAFEKLMGEATKPNPKTTVSVTKPTRSI